ncbi:peptide chain release factor 1 [Blochmannia endosymbiont of Polyrhachis (Hedomyrma) turneri]|uniref:peptide chain release factor 1 n=1 Tax=Blochmannia endosymbiont of Polyrhachis (Hedomyrma) turneri TaxID=1505596 RepID=UPI00061A8A97|nr:peptide chain release factor 1 [Blochmannia endosymbiont of Polyrhachis (Hedomyrma) turneri]AKC59926.1 Peptide chain release factor 1 [Blochmannia endosymbiont of Polyrhachis (Hedomyrma) turneri]
MKSSTLAKLETLNIRYKNLEILLNDPNMLHDQKKFRALFKEYGQLSNLIIYFRRWMAIKKNIVSLQSILEDSEIYNLAQDDIKKLNIDRLSLEKKLSFLLESKIINNDIKGCFCEIRAGTGGHEAALFAGELVRMYVRYAEKSRWKMEIIHSTHGEQGGYKEIIIKFYDHAYKKLQFESGGHRVQRIPCTESQGRIHTSSCTVAVIPELCNKELPMINMGDLRIDTFRSSGAGGQHVNTTDSAIRVTHLPTGIVVACQDGRSQHKNKAKALEILRARLSAVESKRKQEQSSITRRNLLGTGDRSDRIRTYNFHQNRITDHRIGLTVYCLNEVMEGNLDILIKPLTEKYNFN